MSTPKILGGEFAIDPATTGGSAPLPPGHYYSSGRAALMQILRSLRHDRPEIGRIALPDYLCPCVPQIVSSEGFAWESYPLDDRLQPHPAAFDRLDTRSTAVLTVNYYGLVDPAPTIDCLRQRDERAVVIEDNVQALFAMFRPTASDYAFTSLRKWIALPDGGWVRSRHPLPEVPSGSRFAQYKTAAGILRHHRDCEGYDDRLYLALQEQGEELIDAANEQGMSSFSHQRLPAIDWSAIGNRRVENARFLSEQLRRIGITPLVEVPPDSIPFFLPIRVNRRDALRRWLAEERIFCPVHWPLTNPCRSFRTGAAMACEELSLPIDQRYDTEDMARLFTRIRPFYD